MNAIQYVSIKLHFMLLSWFEVITINWTIMVIQTEKTHHEVILNY